MMLPIDLLTLGAAFLAGLLGSPHCAAMCGGIAVGLARDVPRQRALPNALQTNLGRVLGYVIAGTVAGGVGATLLGVLEIPGLAKALRVGVGLSLLWVAWRMVRAAAGTAPPGKRVWRWLTPLQRRLPPPGTVWRPWLQGMLWGWLPCGLSLSLLSAAWLEASALHGGLLMLAFGLGTLPTMATLSYSGARLRWRLEQGPWRWAAAAVVASSGLLTLSAPWLVALPAVHGVLSALGCRSVGIIIPG